MNAGYHKQRAREALLKSMREEGIVPKSDTVVDGEEIVLTPREVAVAKVAAELAMEQFADKVYKQIGKTFVHKVLVWVGMVVAGFVAGKFGFPMLGDK